MVRKLLQLNAVLQGSGRDVEFFAHTLQVEDLVDGAFQCRVAHRGTSFFVWLACGQPLSQQ